MNLAKLLFTVSILTVFFASCDKKDNVDDNNNNALVYYTITATNRSSGLVNWTSGTGSGKQIAFKGNSTTRVEVYALNTNTVDFFTNGALIDTAMVPPGVYANAEFNYQMTPTRSNPALQLKGTYNGVPVTANLDLFTEISTKLPSVTIEARKSYTAALRLDLSAIMNGISASDLNNASRTNGELVISAFSNPALAQKILNNINNVIQHSVEFK